MDTPQSPNLPTTTVVDHLVRRFREVGCEEAFGIVGDFALRMFDGLTKAGFPIRVTMDEQGAGFAADAYARLRGFGVVAVTYGAGGLKVANAAANAWAEQVPLLVLSGAPGVAERAGDPMLHHKVKDFQTQLRVFEDLTCAQAVLASGHTAADEIDRVLSSMLSQQRPGYLEVPRDLIGVPIEAPTGHLEIDLPPVDDVALTEAVADILQHLAQARTTTIHAGVMVLRRRLQSALRDLAISGNFPVASSSLARGVFPERADLGLGLYMGAVSPEAIVRRVEDADLVLSMGVLQTDLTLGVFTTQLEHERLILCDDSEVTVGYRTYKQVPLWALLPALARAVAEQNITLAHTPLGPEEIHGSAGMAAATDEPLTVQRTVTLLERQLDERHGLLLDPGEALFSAVDMRVPSWAHGSAYYATMGYAVPAALGAGRADPQRRPIVVVGDGAFAMTGMEIAGCAFHGVHPVVIVLDNAGYGTQRPIMDGPFNDIPALQSEHLPAVLGLGQAWRVRTEREFEEALRAALASEELSIIHVCLAAGDCSPGLARLGAALARRV